MLALMQDRLIVAQKMYTFTALLGKKWHNAINLFNTIFFLV